MYPVSYDIGIPIFRRPDHLEFYCCRSPPFVSNNYKNKFILNSNISKIHVLRPNKSERKMEGRDAGWAGDEGSANIILKGRRKAEDLRK